MQFVRLHHLRKQMFDFNSYACVFVGSLVNSAAFQSLNFHILHLHQIVINMGGAPAKQREAIASPETIFGKQ